MSSNTVDVRNRILAAARSEFAERGLAGARIDRIAAEASASKERLYAHFTDKVSLFRAVLDLNVREFQEAIPLDPRDVPGFVAAVFDHTATSTENVRMLTWARMEGIDYRLPEESADTAQRLAALREGQRLGTVDPGWHPEDLLELLFALALAWAQSPAHPEGRSTTAADHRRAAIEATRRLIAVSARS